MKNIKKLILIASLYTVGSPIFAMDEPFQCKVPVDRSSFALNVHNSSQSEPKKSQAAQEVHPFFAMDADKKAQAEREEAHPSKELIKKEIGRLRVCPVGVDKLIAAYAENPGKGYMWFKPFFDRGDMFYWYSLDNISARDYQNRFPDLINDSTISIIDEEIHVCEPVIKKTTLGKREIAMLDMEVFVSPKDWGSWAKGGCPYLPKKENTQNFPCKLPAKLMRNLKEGDSLYITLNGVSLELICSQQLSYGTKEQMAFEKRFEDNPIKQYLEKEDVRTTPVIRDMLFPNAAELNGDCTFLLD